MNRPATEMLHQKPRARRADKPKSKRDHGHVEALDSRQTRALHEVCTRKNIRTIRDYHLLTYK
jgi:hypothetical protein